MSRGHASSVLAAKCALRATHHVHDAQRNECDGLVKTTACVLANGPSHGRRHIKHKRDERALPELRQLAGCALGAYAPMPWWRFAQATMPATPKKRRVDGQATLHAFLSPPASTPRTYAEEVVAQVEADERLARELEREWNATPVAVDEPSTARAPRIDESGARCAMPSGGTAYASSFPFAEFASACARASSMRSRHAIVDTLTELFRELLRRDSECVAPAAYLLSNQLAPAYEGVELGLGPTLLQRITAQVSGCSPTQLRALWKQHGDPGDVAYEACRGVSPLVEHRALTLSHVYATLLAIARASGPRSAVQKQRLASALLAAARGEERRFLVRAMCANLRIHATRVTVLVALARAAALETDVRADCAALGVAEERMRRAYARRPDMRAMADALRTGGVAALDGVAPRVGTPITPMLGSITRSLDAVFRKMGGRAYLCEYKYDGQRVQVHAGSDGVAIFSRHLETITAQYPDVCAMARRLQAQGAESFVLDAEVVAVDAHGALLPFQRLATRPRKGIALEDVAVRVCVYAFDVLYVDGAPLLNAPLRARREVLARFAPMDACAAHAGFALASACETRSADETQAFFASACAALAEGISTCMAEADTSGKESRCTAGRRRARARDVRAGPSERGVAQGEEGLLGGARRLARPRADWSMARHGPQDGVLEPDFACGIRSRRWHVPGGVQVHDGLYGCILRAPQ